MESVAVHPEGIVVREGKRIIWWNLVIGLVAAGLLYRIVPEYQVFIVLIVLIRILSIVFEYMLFRAFRELSIFTSLSGIAYAWGAAFLSTVGMYSYEVGEAAFHYGMSVSPYYQIPPNILQGVEGVALLFLGYYFGKLPYGYGKLAHYARLVHVLFGVSLLFDGMVASSASLAYLTALTYPIGVALLLLAVFTEYLLLSRTLALIAQGSQYYPLPAGSEPRQAFEHMADFGYVRNAKQAIGFYFVYLITILVSYILLLLTLRTLLPLFDYSSNAAVIGAVSSAGICVLLAVLVTRDRYALRQFSSIVLIILTLLVALYGKLAAGLVLVAYMTTRRGGVISATSAPTPPRMIQPSSAPFAPHHDLMHLAVLEEEKEIAVPIHAGAAANKTTRVRMNRAQVVRVAAAKPHPLAKSKTQTRARNKVPKAKPIFLDNLWASSLITLSILMVMTVVIIHFLKSYKV